MKKKPMAENEKGLSRRNERWKVAVVAVWSVVGAMLLALGTSSPAYASPGPPGPEPHVAIIPGVAPAGAPVQVMGTNFTKGSTILIGYTTGDCSTNVTSISSASGTADDNGAFTITFQWPDTTTGSYYICATDSTTHVPTKSLTPITIVPKPTLTASSPVYSGQPVTVTGAHYLPVSAGGSSVDVLYGSASNPCANNVGSATVDANGNFTFTFNAPHADTDLPITIIGVEPQNTCGHTPGPTFQAQTNATVSPAPKITVTSPTTAGQRATVSGQDFLPAGTTVEIRYGASGSDGCATALGHTTTSSNGSFSFSFTVPNVATDKRVTIAAVAPQGACSQPTLKATTDGTFKAVKPPFPLWIEYCLIGLLLLLLLLLLLFLVFRRRKEEEPVTIEERDRVFVPNSGTGTGAPGGTALIDRQIVARDRRGNEVVIAEEVTTVEEEEEDLP